MSAPAPAAPDDSGTWADAATTTGGGGGARRRQSLPRIAVLLSGAALTFFGLFWIADLVIAGRAAELGTGGLALFFRFDRETLQNTLGSLAQIIVAVLGIAMTVVSIVVQLAATRYSSHIARMFFQDRTNLGVMGFFVIACIDVVWVSMGVHTDYVPNLSVAVSLCVLSASLLLLIPYLAYVFDFLDPAGVVARIGRATLQAATGGGALPGGTPRRQASAAASVEHLADVAVNALSNKDKVIAARAIGTLRRVLTAYLGAKPRLRAARPEWFALGERLRADADFAAMAPESHQQIGADGVWFEWKVLRQLRSIFAEALQHLSEAAHAVAIATCQIGGAALAAADGPAVSVVLKFFNTYLRTALNARDVRAAYNVLNEYRLLAEDVLARGQDARLLEIAGYFKYYGQSAHAMGLSFVTETAAYDLSVLCEKAFAAGSGAHDGLLSIFLDVDKEAETKAEERALRGVRKAQVRLATCYLAAGAPDKARVIFEDMRHEDRGRLESIRGELRAVTQKDFWEVTDRGINFDYLDPSRHGDLDAFFAWFDEG